MRDPYSVLGVKRNAGADEIKAAWRSKAKSIHPDQNRDDPNATQRFAEVGQAYDMLKDPEKRNHYDQQRSKAEARVREQTIMQQRQAAREAAERARVAKENAERVLAELARAEAEKARADKAAQAYPQTAEKSAAQASTQSKAEKAAQPGAQTATAEKPIGPKPTTAEDPEDMVSRIFGESPEAAAVAESLRRDDAGEKSDHPEGGEHQTAGARNAASTRPLAAIDLLTSLVRRIRGVQPPPEKAPDLSVEAPVAILDLLNQTAIPVTLSDGRELRVNLEGGLRDGDVVRLKGQGLKIQGMQRGDVTVTLRVQKTEKFRVEGFDIHTVLPITLENAVLGCETTVETPTGEVEITIPPWSGSDQVIRLDNLGLPDAEGGRGALAVELRVLLWEKPDDKVTDLMRVMREGLFL
ncbi:MAG TPA: molecular chaperone DnaJ [Rhizobium sp.]|nr:molecular chaperone DnaJ [Rhizobium sp.]